MVELGRTLERRNRSAPFHAGHTGRRANFSIRSICFDFDFDCCCRPFAVLVGVAVLAAAVVSGVGSSLSTENWYTSLFKFSFSLLLLLVERS